MRVAKDQSTCYIWYHCLAATGEPVLHCYGPQKGALITPLRQQQLREQYHFACQCRACQVGFDEHEQQLVGLRCMNRSCMGVVVPEQAVASGLCSAYNLPEGTGNGCCSRSVCILQYATCMQKLRHVFTCLYGSCTSFSNIAKAPMKNSLNWQLKL